jgi:hypothetical protein
MKKKSLLFLILITGLNQAFAQVNLPDFVIADIKGRYHHINSQFVKKRATMLIYFLPDCDDCRNFTTKIVNDKSLFKNQQVIMVTNADLTALKTFVKDFDLENKPNLLIGTEGWTATLMRTLRIKRFPYIATYNVNR